MTTSSRGADDRAWLSVGESTLPIDTLTLDQAVGRVLDPTCDGWRYVVTPNLHHLKLLRRDSSLASLYRDAYLSVPDGWPVAMLASRRISRRVERVAGSDLFDRVLRADGRGRPLVLVGGTPGVGLQNLIGLARQAGWIPSVELAPRPELDDRSSRLALIRRVTEAAVGGVAIVGVGAPRQEKLAHDMSKLAGFGVILCLGMSINFGSGVSRRAPAPIQRLGLEWAHRMIQEPRRLGPRYLEDAISLMPLLAQNTRSDS